MKPFIASILLVLAAGCATMSPAEYAANQCAPYQGEAYQYCVGIAMMEAQYRQQQQQQAMQALGNWAHQMNMMQQQQRMMNRYRNTPQQIRIVP